MYNTFEDLFNNFLDLTEFDLIKHKEDYNEETGQTGLWSLVDRQGGNLGDIESHRFQNAREIFDRMDNYINDYIIESLEEIAAEYGIEFSEYSTWSELINYRDLFPKDCKSNFDYLDMICNHPDEIDLSKCHYEEAYEIGIPEAFIEKYSEKKIIAYENLYQFSTGELINRRGKNIGIVAGIDENGIHMYNPKNPVGYKIYTLEYDNFKKWISEGIYTTRKASIDERIEATENWQKYKIQHTNFQSNEPELELVEQYK